MAARPFGGGTISAAARPCLSELVTGAGAPDDAQDSPHSSLPPILGHPCSYKPCDGPTTEQVYDGGAAALQRSFPKLDLVTSANVESLSGGGGLGTVGPIILGVAVVACVVLTAARIHKARTHASALMLSSSRRGGYFDADSFARVVVQDEDEEDDGGFHLDARPAGHGYSPYSSRDDGGETASV